jgi:hypothetical protein
VEHRPSADSRIAWWSLIVLGLLILLVGGYLLSHFIRIGPRIAIAYLGRAASWWSGSESQPPASESSEKDAGERGYPRTRLPASR